MKHIGKWVAGGKERGAGGWERKGWRVGGEGKGWREWSEMKRRERERGEEEGGDDGFKGEREQSLGGSNSPSCNFVNFD